MAMACGLAALLAIPSSAAAASCQTASHQFTFSGEEQCYEVPAGITTLGVVAVGAPGGGGQNDNPSLPIPASFGARVSGYVRVSPGQTIYVEVGGAGGAGTYTGGTAPGGAGGWNGGAPGASGGVSGAGGGGASDVRTESCGPDCATGGDAASLASRLLVAGGGGGAGGGAGGSGSRGGNGGELGGAGQPGQLFIGSDPRNGLGGEGGQAEAGGAGGAPASTAGCFVGTTPPGGGGSLGAGGAGGAAGFTIGFPQGGGGGGGGLFGGGGGAAGGCNTEAFYAGGAGGGGSSFGPARTTYAVDATGQASVEITPVEEPSATISAPAAGERFNQGESVPTAFSCAEGANGPGLESCSDSEGEATTSGGTGRLDTSRPGLFTYSVTAVSEDGLVKSAEIDYTVAGPPSASITAPSSGGFYAQGQVVPTTFTCAEGTLGPGVESCEDSNGSTTGSGELDTASLGEHTYTVTATSEDGQAESESITYTVAAPPSASITSPPAGGTYEQGQVVPTSFTCAEGASGPGLESCDDGAGANTIAGGSGALDTTTLGEHTYVVTATSPDGQSASASVTYTVVAKSEPETPKSTGPSQAGAPSNTSPPPPTGAPIELGRPRVNPKTGVVTVRFSFPEPGFATLEAGAPGHRTKGARARTLRYGQVKLTMGAAGTYTLRLKPTSRVLASLAQARSASLHLTLAFVPAGTSARLTVTTTVKARLDRG
jgi:hypothetical protein